uniref:Uncharacterized protein n=1 Tax=Rhizophora mucronata TaxID=61149 RepID=A0A2P2NXJ7_RHIMU
MINTYVSNCLLQLSGRSFTN